jgi:hypothetical protein
MNRAITTFKRNLALFFLPIRDAQLIHTVAEGIGIDTQQFSRTAGTVVLALSFL